MLRELSLAPDAAWQEGDIIQLTAPQSPDLMGCFLVVTEPKPFGGVGYLAIPTFTGLLHAAGGRSDYRATFAEGVVCGRAAIVPDAFSVELTEKAVEEIAVPPRVACPPGDFYEHRWGDGA